MRDATLYEPLFYSSQFAVPTFAQIKVMAVYRVEVRVSSSVNRAAGRVGLCVGRGKKEKTGEKKKVTEE